ncbi:MAG: hypothetical protein KKG93_12355, partial [Bacteroidetes bacterium]|nr:hypothetical protein [Bacteroidota bacterium]
MIEMKQPNGVIFTGRGWGDEFAFQYETNNGYRFVKAIDGYYYFATLNAKGEFVKTKLKVGIDSAPAGSYKLDRSADRLAEIDSERVAFNQEVSSNAESFKAKMSALNGLKSVTAEIINLAVICVKFSDTDDNIISHDTRYEKANFEDMLFSQDYWYETNPDGVNDIHPDGHQIFGSVRDFYWQQSLGKKEIIGNVVNSAFHVEFVDWLELPLVKLEYHNNYSENQFADTVMTRAVNAGLFDPADYSYIVIIYAGKREDGGALGPQNFSEIAPYGKSGYIINETYGDTEASAEFGHIGVHAHELGHKFGASDAYVYYPDPRQWSLMSTGSHNGPNFGSCPAGIAPHYKIDWEWVNVSSEITSATSDYSIAYNYDNPVYVKVPIPGSSEYFLLENRLKDSFDKHTPKVYGSGTVDPNDPNRYYGGLLIWHFKPGNRIYIEEIEQADNEINPNEGDPFPFLGQGQDFNDTSIPASHARDGDYSNVSINNIRWIEDGSPSNGYSMVDIEFFENATEIEGNTTWNSDMTLSGPVYVRSNAQLIINAGVDIDVSGPFNNQIKFIVEDNASLKFNGTSANPVTVIPSSGDWGGIEMEGTSSLEILHTTLKNAVRTINFSGSSTSNSCNISNSTIENSQTTLTLIGSIAIDNSMFINAPLALKTIPDGEIGHTVFHSDYSNKNGIHV